MGEIIIEEGEMGSSVYMILPGTVKIKKNPKPQIKIFFPIGHAFGSYLNFNPDFYPFDL